MAQILAFYGRIHGKCDSWPFRIKQLQRPKEHFLVNIMPLIRHKVLERYVFTEMLVYVKVRRMAKELTAREMASMGGRARSEKYSARQIKEWGAMGGRKPKLSEQEWTELFAMLEANKTQEECARKFNISTRTIGRAVAKRKG